MCTECQQDLPILPHGCQRCAIFLPASQNSDLTCADCLSQAPPFNVLHALYPYQPPITELIIKLKFKHELSYAKALGGLLVQKIQTDWYAHKPLPDVIIPVPLHSRRLQERGFNQALEMARPLAKALNLPIDRHHTQRIKHTAAQSKLPATQRKNNMTGAFIATKDYTGVTIAVIDDVVTTGNTIREFCSVLNKHGAKSIDVWCCARRG